MSYYPPKQVIVNMIYVIERQAQQAERERIIKAIETRYWDCGNGNIVTTTVEELTALIKGEQK